MHYFEQTDFMAVIVTPKFEVDDGLAGMLQHFN
jgi:hypothetical protein